MKQEQVLGSVRQKHRISGFENKKYAKFTFICNVHYDPHSTKTHSLDSPTQHTLTYVQYGAAITKNRYPKMFSTYSNDYNKYE